MTVQGFSSFFYGSDPIWAHSILWFLVQAEISFLSDAMTMKLSKVSSTHPYYLLLCNFFFSSSPLLIIQCSLKVQRPGRRSGKDRSSADSLCSCRGVEEGLAICVLSDEDESGFLDCLRNARVQRLSCVSSSQHQISTLLSEYFFPQSRFSSSPLSFHCVFFTVYIPEQIRRINNCMRTGNRCSG